ncbi:glycerol-3-phosphate responsive antiterminator [Paenibacillus oleatilyticus]|uniref:Glycerol uptake operon antiterminator regulatory protein n=1 Tax=Paenibacillus oleatilyticus TaxID=2594886 RepID=A0ABV4V1M3_9BACL
MRTISQPVIPAVRHLKDFEELLQSNHEYLILLDAHLARVKSIVRQAEQFGKKMILHVDLIEGLKADEHAVEFLAQEVKPAGIISTRSQVVQAAKKKKLIAIQRIFMLDMIALEMSLQQLEKTNPDYAEVLPGSVPSHILKHVVSKAGVPVWAGGLLQEASEVRNALDAGVSAVTTSAKTLWRLGSAV